MKVLWLPSVEGLFAVGVAVEKTAGNATRATPHRIPRASLKAILEVVNAQLSSCHPSSSLSSDHRDSRHG
ncbi:MAG TPA: hypothetical protein VNW25_03200 [Candidatus Sulfotelmatobacter sp.]|nr:hypothetical protein [Candidatus Sulfotelmatobacter sp.]